MKNVIDYISNGPLFIKMSCINVRVAQYPEKHVLNCFCRKVGEIPTKFSNKKKMSDEIKMKTIPN